MKSTLAEIRERLKSGDYKNEEHIRFSLVGKILSELGWDIWNPKEVYTEFPPVRNEDSTKVDIALFIKGNFPSVFIEVKGHTKIEQNLSAIEKQLRDYNRNNDAAFTIITDGQIWRFYYSHTQGEYSDKCYRIIDLVKDELQQLEDDFNLLLSKDKIDKGETKKIAEKYLELSTKERAIKDSLSEVYRIMDKDPLLSKVQAIQLCVEEKGYQVSTDEVMRFLDKNNKMGATNAPNRSNSTTDTHMPNAGKETEVADYYNPSVTNDKGLRVTLNGRTFSNSKAIVTFIEAIKLLGIDRVMNNVKTGSKYPLIIKKNELKRFDEKKYKSIDGSFFIYSNNSTVRKKEFLDIAAKQLGISIKVEITN